MAFDLSTAKPYKGGFDLSTAKPVQEKSVNWRDRGRQIAQEEGVDPDLFDKLITAESNWNPKDVSGAGAKGFGQLMDGTAKDLGVSDPFNPEQNLRGAARYLAQQLKEFKSPELALAAYNAGPGTVRSARGRVPNIPETRAYIRRVLGDPGFMSSVGTSWGDRAAKVGAMAERNSDGLLETVVNAPKVGALTLGQVAGGINDVIGEGLSRGYNAFIPESTKQFISNKLAQALESDTGKFLTDAGGSIADAYKDFSEAYPDSAMALEGIGNIFTAAPAGELAYKGAKKTIGGAADATGWAAKNALGITTAQGPHNIETAFKSGLTGNKAFYTNLAEDVPKSDVVDRAKEVLGQMRRNFSNQYAQGMQATRQSAAAIPFRGINDAFDNVVKSMQAGGHWTVDEAERAILGKIDDVLKEWKADHSMHNPIGMDALKRRIDAIYPESPQHAQAQRAVTAVRNAVKNEITKVSPEYATTMKGYEEAIKLERELTRAFSLNDKAAVDTALRKLQSIARNNVNANYGYRTDLAKVLDEAGGGDLIPAIAGQSMSSLVPRGLAGQAESMLTLGSAAYLQNPALLALLPLQSPKMVGAAAYGTGRAIGATGEAISGARERIANSLARALNPNGNFVQPLPTQRSLIPANALGLMMQGELAAQRN